MKANAKLKRILAGLACAGALALSANAQAVTLDAGVLGGVGSPYQITVNPGAPLTSVFTDTINFDLGSWTHFNMSSSGITGNILGFGASIFENSGDTQVVAASTTHTSVFLPNLNLERDYHLHPTGFISASGAQSYTITMWGSTAAPVPVPAAVYLFGTGLIGMVGLARRRVKAMV
jgi:hypothetical protein